MADGLLGAYFGNPNIQRQGARARALAKQRDVNLLADPKTYAVVQGLLGTPPDQLGFSVLNPKYQEIKQVAEPAFYAGSLLQVAPATAPAVNRIAQAVGPRLEQTLLPAFEAAYNRGGLTREMVEAMGTNTASRMFVPATAEEAYKASKMLKKKTPQEVWQEIGIVRGPDNEFRKEISDQSSFIKGSGNFEKTIMNAYERGSQKTGDQLYKTNVGDVLYHNELQKAYPELMAIETQMMPKDKTARGSLLGTSEGQILRVREDLPSDEARSTMLHELQHAIQEKSGFAVGGNTRDFAKMRQDAFDQIGELNTKMGDVVKQMDSPSISKQEKDALRSQYEDLMEQRQALVSTAQLDPMESYGNLMGEAEARLTQRRMNLSDAERRKYFPFEYTGQTGYGLDVPLEGLIQMTPEGTIIRRGLLGR